LKKNYDVFAANPLAPGCADVTPHYIETVPDARPARSRPYRASPYSREVIEETIDRGIKYDTIEPSSSPWAAPVLIVKKKDGSPRFCVDYRGLNKLTIKDIYPLPRIDDTLDRLKGAKYFTSLDAASGYWQVPIYPPHRHKTAFITHRGLHQFKVMPFGLCNAPASFQRMMDMLLLGLNWKFCMVYIDDIIVFSGSFNQHLKHLQLVFDKLRSVNLKLKLSKCIFCRKKFLYLGHQISSKGIATDPAKVIAVKNAPRPTNYTELRSWISILPSPLLFLLPFSPLSSPLLPLLPPSFPFFFCPLRHRASPR
ncbi:RNA-directed DNA polymerase, partial [Patescibacteria group bacterium]|nr:RNA-directed DNA polymerase [Patescibacteria group bacterium]